MTLDINPKQLKIFYYVGRSLSFSKAAEQLCVTQPAVRMQVGALEDLCGTRLLSREGRRLNLTEAGTALFDYAEQLVDVLSRAERTVVNYREHPHGALRIGTTKTWARHLMPTYILRFRRNFPDVEIQLEEGSSEDMASRVLRGVNDMAIVGRIPYDDRLEATSFPGQHADELVLTVHPAHPLAQQRRPVSVEDLDGEPLLLKVRGTGTRHAVDQYFAARRASPSILLESSSTPFITSLVKRNEGVSVLTYLGVEEEERQGQLATLSFEGDGLWLNIDIIHRKKGCLPDAARLFLDFLNNCGEELLLCAGANA